MKKTFSSYVLCWGICFALFQLIAFIAPNEFGTNFWIGWLFISAAFCGQLYCARLTFQAQNAQKLFYSLPLTTVSLLGLGAMLLLGGLTMAVSAIPYWIGVILCAAVLAVTAVALIGTGEAAKAVETRDRQVQENTVFIRLLTSDAKALTERISDPTQRLSAQKVYEALRYSDPVSSDALVPYETQINLKFKEFEGAALAGEEWAENLARELLLLIKDRNDKCKLLKQ